jgi:hypothetical protein
MKLLLDPTLLTFIFIATPGSARPPEQWIEQAAGQDVFDLKDMRVGRLDRYIDINGTPGAIVIAGDNLGGPPFLVSAAELGWRADGGLLLALPSANVVRLPRYHEGWPLPIW